MSLDRICYTCRISEDNAFFREQVLRKRPYLKEKLIKKALTKPVSKEIQSNGRIRYFVYIKELRKYLRVITLDDGKTIHNAFPDRDFKTKYEI